MNEGYDGPSVLYLVRHGESAGNLALTAAESAGSDVIETGCRDADVALSSLGERQATALGLWFAELAPEARPTVILTSPYRRAQHTAQLIEEQLGTSVTRGVIPDERLREKEFGILDQFTNAGVLAHFPDQAALKKTVGKFYYRSPGGESWCDVILRLRSVMESINREQRGQRVVLVGHQVVVLCLRYILEQMTEQEILDIDAAGEVHNCSVTTYTLAHTSNGENRLTLERFNHVESVCS